MHKKLSLVLVTATAFSHSGVHAAEVPESLAKSVTVLKTSLSKEIVSRIRTEPETVVLEFQKDSPGLWIRNNWIRGHYQSPLVRELSKSGLGTADDASLVILTCLWRDLHGQPFGLEEQIASIKKRTRYSAEQVSEPRLLPEPAWKESLATVKGTSIKLSDFKGKVLVLAIVYPNDYSVPTIARLNEVRTKLGKDVEFVVLLAAPSLKRSEKVEFFRKSKATMAVVIDESAKFRDALREGLIAPGNLELPEVIVFGRDRKMVTRFNEWSKSDLLTNAVSKARQTK